MIKKYELVTTSRNEFINQILKAQRTGGCGVMGKNGLETDN